MLTFRLEVGSIRLVLLKDGKDVPVLRVGRSVKAGSPADSEGRSSEALSGGGQVARGDHG